MRLSFWLLQPLKVQNLIGRIICVGLPSWNYELLAQDTMTTLKLNFTLFLMKTNPSSKHLFDSPNKLASLNETMI